MSCLSDVKNFWKNYPKQQAEKEAFYAVFKEDGCHFVAMFYGKMAADYHAKDTGGQVISYRQLVRQLGTGKKFFFYNFYLS